MRPLVRMPLTYVPPPQERGVADEEAGFVLVDPGMDSGDDALTELDAVKGLTADQDARSKGRGL